MLPAAQPRLSSLSRRSMLAGMAALACGRSAWAQSPDGQIVLGQTTALSGPLGDLGQALYYGAQMAFAAVNARGGIHGRTITLNTLDDGYEVVVDLPGFTKDEVQATLENGYLTISAEKGLDKDEKEKESGRYIRKERYAGACSRSFYVGEDITEEDIKAEFKHGLLKLFVPKKEAKPAVEQKKTISIEG